MHARALRRHCRHRLRMLRLPDPVDVPSLYRLVEARRARPLVLSGINGDGGIHGVLLSTDRADYIFYEQRTTPSHREHIILHEICHLLLDHGSREVESGALAALFPHLDTRLVRRLLLRSSYENREEQEAEFLASLILGHASRTPPYGTDDGDDHAEVSLALLSGVLPTSVTCPG